MNTNKKIEQILKQFEKKFENVKFYHRNHSEKLSSTNYFQGLILKAKKTIERNLKLQ